MARAWIYCLIAPSAVLMISFYLIVQTFEEASFGIWHAVRVERVYSFCRAAHSVPSDLPAISDQALCIALVILCIV